MRVHKALAIVKAAPPWLADPCRVTVPGDGGIV